MKYEDRVYGLVTIKEEVLGKLMKTNIMQRLKGIHQGGYLIFINPNHEWCKYNIMRFEHSVGVCILLKKLNASLEEQIAGLLHDASHTIFSHAVDFMFNRHIQHDYHENFHKKMILDSEVPLILKKHGIDVNDILDEKRFTLLERELPDLCADRVDYFLRDRSLTDSIVKKEVDHILNTLTTLNEEIIFNDKKMAKLFAEKYIEANKMLWCNPLQASFFNIISDTLKIAISKGILRESDLFSTDELAYSKLRNSGDREIIENLDLIFNLEVEEDKDDYDMHLRSKVRCTDPKIIENGKLVRLSEIDDSYKEKMEKFIKETNKGFFVKIKK